MKYIVDIGALKECINLLRKESLSLYGPAYIRFSEVIDLINKFPKEKVENEKGE